MGDVFPFTSFTHPVAFDGFCQNDRWRASVLHRSFERGVDLLRVMPPPAHLTKLLVGEMLDHVEQFGMRTEKVLPNVIPRLDKVLLVLAVYNFVHTPDEETIVVFCQERIPITSPDTFDDIPARTSKSGFELLDDLTVTSDRTIETLQVAVDHEDQIVQPCPRRQSDRTEGLRLIGLTVAEKSPDFPAARRGNCQKSGINHG